MPTCRACRKQVCVLSRCTVEHKNACTHIHIQPLAPTEAVAQVHVHMFVRMAFIACTIANLLPACVRRNQVMQGNCAEFLQPEEQKWEARKERMAQMEAVLMSAIHHPNIVNTLKVSSPKWNPNLGSCSLHSPLVL